MSEGALLERGEGTRNVVFRPLFTSFPPDSTSIFDRQLDSLLYLLSLFSVMGADGRSKCFPDPSSPLGNSAVGIDLGLNFTIVCPIIFFIIRFRSHNPFAAALHRILRLRASEKDVSSEDIIVSRFEAEREICSNG